jgi:subtilase family serine protease
MLTFLKKLAGRHGQRPDRPTDRSRPGRVGGRSPRASLRVEHLESRELLSATGLDGLLAHPSLHVQPQGSGTPIGLTPSQVRHAYGVDTVFFLGGTYPNLVIAGGNGFGQTIAIVDAFDDPSIASDLHVFDQQFGLPDPQFTKATPQGQPPPDAGWQGEIALDVEWAHAIAPLAHILLVEAKSNTGTDLLAAVDYARAQPGVSVVSMSFGTSEFAGETAHDWHFQTPAGHTAVSFVASTGDDGSPAYWPAVSPNVLAVGGTQLTIDAAGNYVSETGWSGSGGSVSLYEAKPAYQGSVTQSSTRRTAPDVAYNAAPQSAFAVYDSQNGGWYAEYGTSAGAPQWAALTAIADQGRAFFGMAPLYSVQAALYYATPDSAFHDITSGSNGLPAGTGYDLVTGRGSPRFSAAINSLVDYKQRTIIIALGPSTFTDSPNHPGAGTAGVALRPVGSARHQAAPFDLPSGYHGPHPDWVKTLAGGPGKVLGMAPAARAHPPQALSLDLDPWTLFGRTADELGS